MDKTQIINALRDLSIEDICEVRQALEDIWGLRAAPMPLVGYIHEGTSLRGPDRPFEPTEFTVRLVDVGPNRIQVIRVVRSLFGLGLKDARDIVESAPRVLREVVSRSEMEDMRARFEAAGAKVEVDPKVEFYPPDVTDSMPQGCG